MLRTLLRTGSSFSLSPVLDSYCSTWCPVLSNTQHSHHPKSFLLHNPSEFLSFDAQTHAVRMKRRQSSSQDAWASFPLLHPNDEKPEFQSHLLPQSHPTLHIPAQGISAQELHRLYRSVSTVTRTYLRGSWLLPGLAVRSLVPQSTRYHPHLMYNPSTPPS